MTKDLYNLKYFTSADGINSWKSGSLKFGDALAGLCYAYGITWNQLVAEFPNVFSVDPNGRGEAISRRYVDFQMSFLRSYQTRKFSNVLEIGGGRGEVANALAREKISVTSVEPGPDAEFLYKQTGLHYFGLFHQAVTPVNKTLKDSLADIDVSKFDTILMIESLEHIPAEDFEPFWQEVVSRFHGRFIVTNWPEYHPIWIGRDASPEEHCRLVDDNLYDAWSKEAKSVWFRKGSHLVLDF